MSTPLIERNPGGETSLKVFYLVSAAYHLQWAEHLARKNGKNYAAQGIAAELRGMHAQDRGATEAGLMLGLFSDAKPLALKYLEEWCMDRDLKSTFAVVQSHMEAAKSCGISVQEFSEHLRNWAKLQEGTLREVVAKENQVAAERKRNEDARHASGQCIMCGKEIGFLARVLLRKSHLNCKEFIPRTSKLPKTEITGSRIAQHTG